MKTKTFLALIVALVFPSCGVSGRVDIPLPPELGGGTVPIVIIPTK